jgi:drug/metabolite transporter (DMT)-like permease
MLVSYFLLKTRYQRTHLLGAAVIVAGVAVTVAPEFGGGGT